MRRGQKRLVGSRREEAGAPRRAPPFVFVQLSVQFVSQVVPAVPGAPDSPRAPILRVRGSRDSAHLPSSACTAFVQDGDSVAPDRAGGSLDTDWTDANERPTEQSPVAITFAHIPRTPLLQQS